jgi:hypothetical protein
LFELANIVKAQVFDIEILTIDRARIDNSYQASKCSKAKISSVRSYVTWRNVDENLTPQVSLEEPISELCNSLNDFNRNH